MNDATLPSGLLAASRILVIDDNQAIHQDFRKIFARRGPAAPSAAEQALFGTGSGFKGAPEFQIDSAYQGEEGLALVRRAQEERNSYAIAFVDVRMPPGWDGVETTSRIWRQDPDIQIVICTAFSDYSWSEMLAKLGRSDRLVILKKPFETIEVVQLASALGEKWRLARQSRLILADLERRVADRTRELVRAGESLKASEAQYRLLFDSNPHPMWVYDTQTLRFLTTNGAAVEHYGYSEQQFLAMTTREIRPAEDVATLEKNVDELQGQGKSFGMWRHRKRDGSLIDVEISSDRMVFNGRPSRLVLAHDVTKRNQAEARIKRLNRVYAVLSQINGLIVRVKKRAELFEGACRIAVEAGGFSLAWIGVVDRSAMQVKPVAWQGAGQDYLERMPLSLSEGDGERFGLAARTVLEKAPVIVDDMQHDARVLLRAEAGKRDFHSLVMLPLMVSGTVEGMLALYASEVGFFDESEMKLLLELAGDIAFALENIEKQEKVERLTRVYAVLSGINALIVRVKERAELFDGACRIAVEQGKFAMAWVGAFDPATQDVTPMAWAGENAEALTRAKSSAREDTPAGAGGVGRAIRERRPVFNNDIAAHHFGGPRLQEILRLGFQSQVTLPLYEEQAIVATLTLYTKEPDFFDAEELRLLTQLAGDISFALENLGRQAQLDYLAYYDPLTGLANRRLFLERVAQYMRSAVTGGHQLALFLVDLERFKNINDSLGRPAGDALLKQVADWLTRNVQDANLVARVGADHFAVVLPQVRQDGSVARLIENAVEGFQSHPFRLNDAVFRIALKVGIALFPQDGTDADILFKNVEAALKKAKASGERFLFYTQKMTDTVAGKLTLENQLRQALDKEEFVLHYQPKISLASGKLTSAEALIRWNDPRSGLVPPGRFIPVLEETGLIQKVGHWALRKAVGDYLRWRSAGLPAVRIAVNVSALQLRNRAFIEEIKEVIGIDTHAAEGLELEITESLIMEDVKHNIASLQAIRALGVTIAIDDFGTGFSSLSYLSKLPVDTLKIDRSFVIDMTVGPQGLALVSTIITLAHSLKLKVVAEGVETEEQQRLLRLLGCDEMQGYLFSKPVPGEIFQAKFLAPATAAAPPAT